MVADFTSIYYRLPPRLVMQDTKPPRFSDKYAFEKPNDRRALDLMNAAAKAVMGDLPDIVVAYGISDEFRSVWPCWNLIMSRC